MQRKRLLKRITNQQVRRYLQTPFPDKKLPVLEAEYLVLDFETTGLDAKKEAILSIGYTLIQGGRVMLKDNRYHIIRVNRPLPDASVVVHKITEERARQGEPLHRIIEQLLEQMTGRILLVHYANVEKNFLNAVFQQLFTTRLPMMIADTLDIEQSYLLRHQQSITQKQLRLFNLRRQYNLPRYNAHNALEDAIATAELFLAQMSHRQTGNTRLTVGDVTKIY